MSQLHEDPFRGVTVSYNPRDVRQWIDVAMGLGNRGASRPSWDQVWAQVARDIAQRSLCSRSRVGAVIVDDQHRIVSTGYNGPPALFEHHGLSCENWCPRGQARYSGFTTSELELDKYACFAVHAEANAIITGDRSSWQGGTMYGTKHPCLDCAKLIANSGLNALVVRCDQSPLPEHTTRYMFLEECGVQVEVGPQ